MTIQPVYEFDGWIFEYYRTKPFGPWPLKKDHEPRARAGNKFYNMFDRFHKLSIDEQETYRLWR
jgi:hypothetical protein